MLTIGLFVIIGILAGILTGLMGSSGVLIVIPSVVLLGYRIHQGVGISLAVDMIASIIVALTYLRHGRVNIRQGLWTALAAMVGAQVGSRFSVFVPESGLSCGYGIVLIANAVLFWRKGTRREIDTYRDSWIAARFMRHP